MRSRPGQKDRGGAWAGQPPAEPDHRSGKNIRSSPHLARKYSIILSGAEDPSAEPTVEPTAGRRRRAVQETGDGRLIGLQKPTSAEADCGEFEVASTEPVDNLKAAQQIRLHKIGAHGDRAGSFCFCRRSRSRLCLPSLSPRCALAKIASCAPRASLASLGPSANPS
jgi:hypothetical protein